MAAQVEAAPPMVYNAACRASAGFASFQESAMAGLMTGGTAMKAAARAVQNPNGFGCTRDLPVERMMQDAGITGIHEGMNEVQRPVIGTA
jgi:alkylation response protein AidB-like acyl-CoA dehydrogenase